MPYAANGKSRRNTPLFFKIIKKNNGHTQPPKYIKLLL
jgi:hypothetical protein